MSDGIESHAPARIAGQIVSVLKTDCLLRGDREVPPNGAEGETRTPTGVSPLRPEHSVSTNSTTSAKGCDDNVVYSTTNTVGC